MGAGYVAFGLTPAGSPAELRATSARLAEGLTWIRRIATPNLEVWTCPEGPAVAQLSDAAFAIGDVRWRRADGHRREPTVNACAQRLIRDAWGGYIALLGDGEGWSVLRDPSGELDGFTWRRGGLWVVASDIDGVPHGVGPPRMALDWDVLALCTATGAAVVGRSPLHGLTAVTPGDLVSLDGPGAPIPVWRPRDFVGSGRAAGDPAQLVTAVEEAVGAAFRGDDGVLMEVSGGLDSAILAGTVGRLGLADRVVAALHFRGDRPEADESGWASCVATRLGWPVEIAELTPTLFDLLELEDLSRGARPAVNALDRLRDQATVAAAAARSARVLVTGKGGDTVFFQPPTTDILADYLLEAGWRGIVGPLAQGLARRLRRSIWSVGGEARRRLRNRAPPSLISPLLGPRGRAQAATPFHPWVEGIGDLPPGKQVQIEAIAATFNVRGVAGYVRELDVRHPLLSQPVLEASLALPTWRLAPDGRERGLARALFADRVPEPVLRRRSKGELGAYYARTLALSGEVLKPLLLDGVLCGAEVLDRRAVEAALAPDTLICRSEGPALMSAIAAEVFARYWQTRIPDWPENARRPQG
jgi:asparagine synthase (glutamine-hydrolysing)